MFSLRVAKALLWCLPQNQHDGSQAPAVTGLLACQDGSYWYQLQQAKWHKVS